MLVLRMVTITKKLSVYPTKKLYWYQSDGWRLGKDQLISYIDVLQFEWQLAVANPTFFRLINWGIFEHPLFNLLQLTDCR